MQSQPGLHDTPSPPPNMWQRDDYAFCWWCNPARDGDGDGDGGAAGDRDNRERAQALEEAAQEETDGVNGGG